jgi:ubiquinone/menaquinone biosynthesis C-methylase UbiE
MLNDYHLISQGQRIQQHFHSESGFWNDVYKQDTLLGAIYRERRDAGLRFDDDLTIPAGSRLLDVGCGAGSTAVALASRGHSVDAVDIAPRMIALTRQAVLCRNLESRVRVHLGDVHQLPFPDGSFDCVVAVGVMEWMTSRNAPLRELHRVLRPGGWLIVNVDNANALHCLLDPRMHPVAAPIKRFGVRFAERIGLIPAVARCSRCSPARFDRELRFTGFLKRKWRTTGFGPFTLFGAQVLPQHLAIRVHRSLQRAAYQRASFLRDSGDAYLVLAQKFKPRMENEHAAL